MRAQSLKDRILTAYAAIIVLLAVCIFGLGFYVIKKDIYERTQQRVIRSLDSARIFYQEEINRIGVLLSIANLNEPDGILKEKLRLNYLERQTPEQAKSSTSEIVRKALETSSSVGGSRIISKDELALMNNGLKGKVEIPIYDTPKARPTNLKVLETAMAKEYAFVVKDENGRIKEVVYGGRIINRDNELVDRIRKLVFGDELYHQKPIGTVTIFQNDVRISTNVLNEKGERAIGTRVSEEVYRAVMENGDRWLDNAFVVTHWYKTAYEPIRSIDGKIIGMLYVGILEEPFNAMAASVLMAFVLVVLLASVMAFFLSVILAGSVMRPMKQFLTATDEIATGKMDHKVEMETSIIEMDQLAESFNEMFERISERESRIKLDSEKLTELNKSYLDLLGFVAHELKGLLSSAVINAYSLRDGLLGMINFKQKKAVDSICRNLDYLDATVKKFLNLSRIERGNLEINKTEFSLGKDVFENSVQTFARQFSSKNMEVVNTIDPAIRVKADMDLMQIAANNLINNAVKYGADGGKAVISAQENANIVTVEVYNDSRPIAKEMVDQLFRKFSRLDVPEKKQVKGTGLGLYITKQIIESHGGTIRVEPRENGNSFIFTMHKE